MAKDIKKALLNRRDTKSAWTTQDLLGTGSTLLNLALSGHYHGGFIKGRYFFLVGDSQSGKTFLALTCFAEACLNPAFKDYRLIFDDVEGGALMDITRFFGKGVARRLEAPRYDGNEPIFSQTVEEFYVNLNDVLEEKVPCIYVLDSMDALTSIPEQTKFKENRKAIIEGFKPKGEMTDAKAKKNSSGLRSVLPLVRDTGSILIIINQTRDNVNAGPFEPQQTRSGGRALTFYASAEIWSGVGTKIKKNVKGKDRVIGVQSRLVIKKNRITGKNRTTEIPIKYEYGIDDIASCVDYLIEEGYWKKGRVVEIESDFFADGTTSLSRDKLIKKIEEEGKQDDLRKLVQETWDEIEKLCSERRKPRYE